MHPKDQGSRVNPNVTIGAKIKGGLLRRLTQRASEFKFT